MFNIPSFYKEEVSFQDAWNTIKSYGLGDALAGMNGMNDAWDNYIASQNALFNNEVQVVAFEDDDDFFEYYGAECNAYNKVFESMTPMFA